MNILNNKNKRTSIFKALALCLFAAVSFTIRIVRRRYGHPAILSLHGGNHARAEQGHKGADGGNPL